MISGKGPGEGSGKSTARALKMALGGLPKMLWGLLCGGLWKSAEERRGVGSGRAPGECSGQCSVNFLSLHNFPDWVKQLHVGHSIDDLSLMHSRTRGDAWSTIPFVEEHKLSFSIRLFF